eukprot:CAMPEP_0118659940 /NCGR_PEP_ID=MMETSP0785-20121206/15389_1 /TAXON_ID=91992 /ORGANISM="Bolidomonas pacifica, Strain CCMP 1866" /LENGTH=77 /DNA_ID=CAMNT_0006553097 /DNA_START=381 /DNA_END=611 /DNA_ORIENTATION=-
MAGVVDRDLVGEGKYTSKVLKPLSDVTEDDVVSSLPPELGGTFSFASEMLRVRDFVCGQVDQLSQGNDDKEAAVEFL